MSMINEMFGAQKTNHFLEQGLKAQYFLKVNHKIRPPK
jgi:hypothetical protein